MDSVGWLQLFSFDRGSDLYIGRTENQIHRGNRSARSFVGMSESIHVARWTKQIIDEQWDLHLFPVREASVCSEFRHITVYRRRFARPKNLHKSVRILGFLPFLLGEQLLLRVAGKIART